MLNFQWLIITALSLIYFTLIRCHCGEILTEHAGMQIAAIADLTEQHIVPKRKFQMKIMNDFIYSIDYKNIISCMKFLPLQYALQG